MAQPLCGQLAMAELENNQIEDNREVVLAPEPAAAPAPNFGLTDQPSYARILFMGPNGLRAGWGFSLYLLMLLPLLWLASLAPNWFSFSSGHQLRSLMVTEFANLLSALLPALVLSRIEHRPWGVYGLPLRRAFGKDFWVGLVWGFASISLLLGALYGLHNFNVDALALHGRQIAKFAVFWGAMFLLVGFFEEYLLRGYTQYTLARGIGFWPAALVLSVLFGLLHLKNPGETWLGLLAVVYIGLFFCLTLRRTGDLWFAVGFHAAWDWGETFFYSVPDSGGVFPGHLLQSSFHGSKWLTGGSVGPEGSVLCFVVVGLTALLFDRTYREAKYKA